MSDILLFTKNADRTKFVSSVLKQHNLHSFSTEEDFEGYFKNNAFDIMLIDTVNLEDAVNFCRSIKFSTQIKNVNTILIVNPKEEDKSYLKYAPLYISDPIDKDILIATVNSALLAKHSLDELAENNAELSKSLYRLNVLNKTVTELTGSQNKMELIKIMTEGIEKSLSYQLCYSLVFNDPTDITLIINSVHAISPRLEEAIKFRAMLSYKNYFNIHTKKEEIKVIKNIKRKEFEYDMDEGEQ